LTPSHAQLRPHPRDFYLFLNLKEHLAGQKYHEDKEVEEQSHYMVARAGGAVL